MLIATALLVLQASVVLSAIVPDRQNVGVLFNWEKYKDFHGEYLLRWNDLIDYLIGGWNDYLSIYLHVNNHAMW